MPISWLRGLLGVGVLLVLWEWGLPPGLFPRASQALPRAAALALDPGFLADLGGTLRSAGTGLLLAAAVAVPLGVALASLPRLEPAARPVIEFLRPVPSVALIPLALVLFPADLGAKAAVVCYGAAWPILINTMYGLRETDPVAKDTLRAFGFGPAAVLWRVSLPSAAPFIATGVRLAAAIALILAISMEFIAGGSAGLGRFLIQAGSGPDALADMVAAALWAGLLGFIVNVLLEGLERRIFRWRISVR